MRDVELYRQLVDHLKGGAAPPTDAREGLLIVRAVQALRQRAGAT